MGMGMNFYPRVWISTRSVFAGGQVIALPDLLSSLDASKNQGNLGLPPRWCHPCPHELLEFVAIE
jgi:hypothetical protein